MSSSLTPQFDRREAAQRPSLRLVVCGSTADDRRRLLGRIAGTPGTARDTCGSLAQDIHDSPAQDTRDIATAACTADLAIVLVDAQKGITRETRRHSALIASLGVRQVVLAVNAMDRVGHAQAAFEAIAEAFAALAARVGLDHANLVAIPLSATGDDNVDVRSAATPWYAGPVLRDALARAEVGDARATSVPPPCADRFEASLVWVGAEPLLRGRSYRMKLGAGIVDATVAPIKYRLDPDTLQPLAAGKLDRDDVGVCDLELDRPMVFERCADNRELAAFTLLDRMSDDVVGIGVIRFALRRAANLPWQSFDIDRHVRARMNAQKPCVLWFTGLSGAGKSTIANRVERALSARGHRTYLLDGDNLRRGLNKDLGFTAADRVENIRRVAEVAALMADAGLIVLTAFISPFRAERAMARALLPAGEFVEVFIDTPLALAESRDPKGLYAKARRGELVNFTGIDSPYERPLGAEIRIDGAALDAEAAARLIIAELERRGVLTG